MCFSLILATTKEHREELDGGKKENFVGGFVGICIKKTLSTFRFLQIPPRNLFLVMENIEKCC